MGIEDLKRLLLGLCFFAPLNWGRAISIIKKEPALFFRTGYIGWFVALVLYAVAGVVTKFVNSLSFIQSLPIYYRWWFWFSSSFGILFIAGVMIRQFMMPKIRLSKRNKAENLILPLAIKFIFPFLSPVNLVTFTDDLDNRIEEPRKPKTKKSKKVIACGKKPKDEEDDNIEESGP